MPPTVYAALRVLDRAVLLAIYLASLWLIVWWNLDVAIDRHLDHLVTAGTIVTAIIAYAAAWCSSSAFAPPYGGDAPVARSFLASLVPMALVEMSLQPGDVQPRIGPGADLFFAWAITRDAMFVILLGGPIVRVLSLVVAEDPVLPCARVVRDDSSAARDARAPT